MNKYIRTYIDHQIIDEYAEKDLTGYSLQVIDLPENEQNNLIDVISIGDPDFKSYILDYAQKLINERLTTARDKDLYGQGYKPMNDSATGEVTWVPKSAGGY